MKMPLRSLAAMLVLAPALGSADDGFSMSIGAHHSSGDYGGDTRTDITTVPVTAAFNAGRWSLTASLPWLRVAGDPNVLPGTGPVLNLNPLGRGRISLAPLEPDGDFGRTSGSASGVGDLTLRAGYALPTRGPVAAEIAVTAKVATADEDKGLGTGANDYGVSLDLAREVGTATLFGGISHLRQGETAFVGGGDTLGANAGARWRAGNGQLGLAYDFRESASPAFEDRREITASYSVTGARDSNLQVYGLAGLSDGSPDWGAGVSYGWRF